MRTLPQTPPIPAPGTFPARFLRPARDRKLFTAPNPRVFRCLGCGAQFNRDQLRLGRGPRYNEPPAYDYAPCGCCVTRTGSRYTLHGAEAELQWQLGRQGGWQLRQWSDSDRFPPANLPFWIAHPFAALCHELGVDAATGWFYGALQEALRDGEGEAEAAREALEMEEYDLPLAA